MSSSNKPPITALFSLPNKASTWLVYALLIAALTAIFYGHTRHLLLALDDANMFAENLAFDRDLTHFFAPAEKRVHGSGRPFTDLVKYVAFKVWGHHIPAYHLLVVGAHACCALLLAYCAFRLGSPLDLSLLTGLLFLANVSHSGALHWLSALDYPLAAIWSLAIVLCHVRGQDGGWRWLVAFHLALLCGLLSHIAVVSVAPFCLYWSWQQGRSLLGAVLRLAPGGFSLVFAAAAAAYTTQRKNTSSFVYDRLVEGSSELVLEMGRVALWMMGRMVATAHWLPVRLHEQYDWEILIGGGMLVAGLLAVFKRRFPQCLWSAWTLFALIPFIPAALVHTGIDRYVYTPAIGVSGILAWGLYSLCAVVARRYPVAGRAVCIGATGLLLASSHTAIQRVSNVFTYASAKYYLAYGEFEIGVRLMREALANDSDTINKASAYTALLTYLIAKNRPFADELQQAREVLPDDDNIRAISIAVDLLDDDSAVVTRSQRVFEEFNRSLGGEQRVILWHLMKTTLRNLGHRAARADDPVVAVRAFRQALLFDDERFGTLFYLALALLQAGAPEDAETVARELLAADPHDEDAYLILAQAASDRGDLKDALRICSQQMSVGAGSDFYFLASDLLWRERDYERALDYFQAGIAKEAPAQPARYLQWAAGLRALGRTDEARARIEEGLRSQPAHSGMLYELGNLHQADGRDEQALQAYAKVAAALPDHVDLQANLGIVLSNLGRAAEAEQALRQALRLDSSHANANAELGWILHRRGRLDEAIAHYELVLRQGTHSAAEFNQGLALLEKGRVAEAERAYARAVKHHGAEEAIKIGAVEDLRRVVDLGVQSAAARAILGTYWP